MRAWEARFRASIQELSPERIALLFSVGLVLGVFPIMGCPTVLCLLAAIGLRLNAPALQLLNNVSSPLQLVLLLPLERVGSWLCGDVPAASVAGRIGMAAMHAIAGWAFICVPCGLALYAVTVRLVRKHRQSWCNRLESPA
jgi:uncharacterized protein (DUF2062 family)